jgi:hypothetical protein
MTDNRFFTDSLTGEKFNVAASDVYYLLSLTNGTMIKLHDNTDHVVGASFAAVCRELGYCEAE